MLFSSLLSGSSSGVAGSATSMVQAWTYTTPPYPSTLARQHVPVSSVPPNATSIVVRMAAVALNPVDIQLMNFGAFSLPGLSWRKIPCGDFAGTVLAAGAASGFKAGDAVFGLRPGSDGQGVLSEAQVVDTAKHAVLKRPEHWSAKQAAALPLVWLTARTCVEQVQAWMGASTAGAKTVVVLGGASATGAATVFICAQRGWRVVASCSPLSAAFVRGIGAVDTIDYTRGDAAVREAVRAARPAAIVDCVGGTICTDLAPRYVTIVGDKTGRSALGGPVTYLWSVRQNLRWLVGYCGSGIASMLGIPTWAPRYDVLILQPITKWLAEMVDLLGSEPDKVIRCDRAFTFEQADRAFQRLDEGNPQGKVLVEFPQ